LRKTKTIKAHSLTGRITFKKMKKAFLKVKRNKGKAGIDGVNIRMFEQNLNENLAALMKDIKTGKYYPCPLKRVYIPKNGGGQRPLGIPIVRDRIAQEVIRC